MFFVSSSSDTINSLERERKDLDCLLGNLDSPVLKAKSKRQTDQLTTLLNNLKGCRQEILDELERLRKFNLEVASTFVYSNRQTKGQWMCYNLDLVVVGMRLV